VGVFFSEHSVGGHTDPVLTLQTETTTRTTDCKKYKFTISVLYYWM